MGFIPCLRFHPTLHIFSRCHPYSKAARNAPSTPNSNEGKSPTASPLKAPAVELALSEAIDEVPVVVPAADAPAAGSDVAAASMAAGGALPALPVGGMYHWVDMAGMELLGGADMPFCLL